MIGTKTPTSGTGLQLKRRMAPKQNILDAYYLEIICPNVVQLSYRVATKAISLSISIAEVLHYKHTLFIIIASWNLLGTFTFRKEVPFRKSIQLEMPGDGMNKKMLVKDKVSREKVNGLSRGGC